MSEAVAPSPSIWTMGSPGTRWIRRKTTVTTTQRTGKVMRMRRNGGQNRDAVGRRIDSADACEDGTSGEIRGFFTSLRVTPSRRPSVRRLAAKFSLDRFPTVDFVDGFLVACDIFDDDAVDATAGHLGDTIATAFVLEAFADDGDVS